MRFLLSIAILLILTLNSCVEKIDKSSINSIWVGDYSISYYYSDSTGHIDFDAPILIDFTIDDSVIIKQRNGFEYRAVWIPQDSILQIDSIEYKVLSANKDSLVYFRKYEIEEKELNNYLSALETANKNEFSTIAALPWKKYYVFKRIHDYRLDCSKANLSDLLENKLFKFEKNNCPNYRQDEYLEFLDNGAVISRNTYNVQKEIQYRDYSWKTEIYKGYPFLILYNEFYQYNLTNTLGYQIIEINDNSFSFLSKLSQSRITYTLHNRNSDKPTSIDLTGIWISRNDTVHFLKYLRSKKKEQIELILDGILKYDFSQDSVNISFNGIDFYKYKWRWNTDYTLLVFENEEVFNEYEYSYVDYLKIINLENDTLKLELNDKLIIKNQGNEIYDANLQELQTFVKEKL